MIETDELLKPELVQKGYDANTLRTEPNAVLG